MKKILYILLSVVLLCSLLMVGCQPAQEAAPTLTEENTLNLYGIDPLTLDPVCNVEVEESKAALPLNIRERSRLDMTVEPTRTLIWQKVTLRCIILVPSICPRTTETLHRLR